MPWLEAKIEVERTKFVAALLDEPEEGFAALCKRFGISRQTGYEWKRRFEREGPAGLVDRSSRPHSHPNETPADIADRLVAVRKAHPTWGPKKLRAHLAEREPGLCLPAASTIGEILTRRGLTAARKRRVRVPPAATLLKAATCPNALWATDHKGSFRLTDGRVYPLTISDGWSRFFLKCEALTSTSEDEAWPHYEAAFREYGLPVRIRSDNGVPFANPQAMGRLSRLSVRWVKLGIGLERIEPGHPEQNGAHERLHLTMEEVIAEGRIDRAEQQRRFDHFRREYNHERPHEALGQRTPASVYETSWRPYPAVLPSVEYDVETTVRRVSSNGSVKWRGHDFFVTSVLNHEPVGFRELDDDRWTLWFGPVFLCTVDLRGDEPRFGFVQPTSSLAAARSGHPAPSLPWDDTAP